MNEETVTPSENTTPSTESTPTDPSPTTDGPSATSAVGLLAEVAEAVKTSTPAVRARLVESMVEKEIKARAELLGKALDARSAANSEHQKINKPDVVTYNEHGVEVAGNYTKDHLKKIKESKDKLVKIEKAIELALGGDWTKLKELKC